MKAHWDLKDYQAMYQHRFRFSDRQAYQLANRYGGSPPQPSLALKLRPESRR
jgi:hypothetical protein